MSGSTAPSAEALRQAAGRVTLRWWLMVTGITALLALTALSTYNAVTTDRFVVDLSISRWVQKLEVNESLEEVLFYMGVIGVGGVTAGAVFLWQWLRGYRVDAIVLLLGVLPNAANFLLRDLFGRPRPEVTGLVNVVGGPQGLSYPSGHALMVVFLYGFLLYLLTKYTSNKRVIYTLQVLFALYVPFAGLWLIHHGRHWPSDVFGGYLYGSLYLVIWIGLYRVAKAWERRHPDLLTWTTLRRIGARLRIARGS